MDGVCAFVLVSEWMVDPTPAKPIDGSVSRDPAWLAALYLDHAPGLRRFVVGVLRDREAADDVVQATFAKAAQAAADIPPEAIRSWLYRVAFHEAVNWKRRSQVQRKATRKLWDRQQNRGSERPEEPLVRREIVEQVREAVEGLSANQLEVVRARVYQDRTFAQIAAEMGLPLGTVLTHMRRALDQLRRKLKRDD
jgi:RNA polymerase sigma-70 factor (ECF subfamily)